MARSVAFRAGGVDEALPDAGHVEDVLENVERFVWSHPEIEVIDVRRHWLDTES